MKCDEFRRGVYVYLMDYICIVVYIIIDLQAAPCGRLNS